MSLGFHKHSNRSRDPLNDPAVGTGTPSRGSTSPVGEEKRIEDRDREAQTNPSQSLNQHSFTESQESQDLTLHSYHHSIESSRSVDSNSHYDADEIVLSEVSYLRRHLFTTPSSHSVGNIRRLRHVTASLDQRESHHIDPTTYTIGEQERRKFFGFGRVFITLWTEHTEPRHTGDEGPNTTFLSHVTFEDSYRPRIRRFVVVREGDSVVHCLPITSYNGVMHRKEGIELADHGQIYIQNCPERVTGMLPDPLKLIPANGGALLQDHSLVNYRKTYTVETDVRVKDVGTLDSASKLLLQHYFQTVSGIYPAEPDIVSIYGENSLKNRRKYRVPLPHGSSVHYSPRNTPNPYSQTNPAMSLYGISGGAGCRLEELSQRPDAGDALPVPFMADGTHYLIPGNAEKSELPQSTLNHDPVNNEADHYPTSPLDSGPNGRDDQEIDLPTLEHVQRTRDPQGQQRKHEIELSANRGRKRDRERHNQAPTLKSLDTNPPDLNPKNEISRIPEDHFSEEPLPFREDVGSGFNLKDTLALRALNAELNAKELPGLAPRVAESIQLRNLLRGIILAPRGYFTEDQAPVREGKAPIQDAQKDCIPHETKEIESRGGREGSRSRQKRDRALRIGKGRIGNEENSDSSTYRENADEGMLQILTKAMCKEDMESGGPSDDAGVVGLSAKPGEKTTESSILEGSLQPALLVFPTLNEEYRGRAHRFEAYSNEFFFDATSFITRDSSPRSRSPSILSSRSFASTLSSIAPSLPGGHPSGSQKLMTFLTRNKDLHELCARAFQTVTLAEFTEHLRLFLIEFARALKEEASPPSILPAMRKASRIISRSSRAAADTIARDLQSQAVSQRGCASDLSELPGSFEITDHDEDVSEDSERENTKNDADDELGKLGESLLNSTAFKMLKENLEILSDPDNVQRALLQVWPLHVRRTAALQIDYDLQWSLFLFIKNNFRANQKLGDVMTLTGGALDAQALSCKEYLRMSWPRYESLLSSLLELIESSVQGNRKVTLQLKGELEGMKIELRSTDIPFSSDSFETAASFTVFANHEIHAVIISALSWLCAAIRYSPFTDVVHSSVSISGNTTKGHRKSLKLRLDSLEELPAHKTCWHSLFPHAVIAKGFATRDRRQGKGLEISFSNMVLMSRTMSFVEYDGGLLVEGLRSLLIPVKVLDDDNALQWHYASKKQKHSRKQGRIAGILSGNNIKEWHRELRSRKLVEMRCFLGWAEEISIMVGTENYSSKSIRWSGTEKYPKPVFAKSQSISMDADGLTYRGDDGAQLHMPTAVPSSVTFVADKEILDDLVDEQDTDILVYDTGSKTASFLPHACVVLLLIRNIVDRRGYQLFDGRNRDFLDFAQPSSDGANEAIEVLVASLSLKVRKLHARKSAPLDDFSVLVKQVLQMIETLRTGMESIEKEFARLGVGAPKFLHGVELMDMVKMSSRLRIREAEIDQAWTYLGGHHSTVLFCRGLGQPIVPAQPEKQCGAWMQVPSGRNYLVMTGLTIKHLLEQYEDDDGGSRLGQNLEWIFAVDDGYTHRPGLHGVAHVQHVREVNDAKVQKRLCERISECIASGFIFSDAKIPQDLCYELSLDSAAALLSYQDAGDIDSAQVLIHQPDNTSDTSFDTDGSSIGEQLATDSMSSNEAPDQQDQNEESSNPVDKPSTSSTMEEPVLPVLPVQRSASVIVTVKPRQRPVEGKTVDGTSKTPRKKEKSRTPGWLLGSLTSSSTMKTSCGAEQHRTSAQSGLSGQIRSGKERVL